METNVVCTDMECRTVENGGRFPEVEINARITFTRIGQVDAVAVDIIRNALAGIVKERTCQTNQEERRMKMKKALKWIAGFLLGIVLVPVIAVIFPFTLALTMKGDDDDE